MPRFYFDTDDGEDAVEDVFGIDLADAEVARDVAVATLPKMAQDVSRLTEQHKIAVHVADAKHKPVFVATLNIDVDWK